MAEHSKPQGSRKDSTDPPGKAADADQPTSGDPQRSSSDGVSAQPNEPGRDNVASRSSESEVNEPPPISMTPDGMLEEQISDWPKSNWGPVEDDPRTLAELAADVMKAAAKAPAAEESLRPGEVSDGESTPEEQPVSQPTDDTIGDDAGDADVAELPADGSRNRWAALIVVVILLFAAGGGFLWFDPTIGSSEGDPGADGKSAAATEGAADDGAATGGTPSGDGSPPAAAKEPPPTPKPTTAVEPTPIPAADPEPVDDPNPEPTAEPVATPTPRPTPVPTPTVAPAPGGAHVADLIASIKEMGKKVRVSVEIHVHDSAHNPVAGATVSGQWAGGMGSASCVTGRTGSCAAQTDPLASPGSVTFTVAGIADAGEPYEPILNHDLDGDSNGTSVTIEY